MESRRQGGFSKRCGFTVLEVVIALAIFAMAIGTLAASYLNVLYALDSLDEDQSVEQDMALIRQFAFSIETLEELEEGGEVETPNNGIAIWRVESETTELADLFFVRLIAELRPQEKKEAIEVEQEFYLLRPSWSDSVERDTLRSITKDKLLEHQSGADFRSSGRG